MTKLKTYWYDQWDEGKPRPPSTSCRTRRIAITLAVWRKPALTRVQQFNPDLTTQLAVIEKGQQ